MAFFASKLRSEKGMNALARDLDSDDTGAEHQHIHVVMLDALVGGVSVMTDAGANAANFVSGDAGADAAAADEDAAFGLAVENCAPDFFGVIGIVGWRGRICTDVDYLVTLLFEIFDARNV